MLAASSNDLPSTVIPHQYVRVMPAGGQCYDPGPFFATTPRHMTRLGIRRRRNLLLRPDWLVTGGLLFGAVLILCLCVTVMILFHEYGWPEKKPIRAQYHSRQRAYHMEDYASKGSRLISQMKIHRKPQGTMTLSSFQHDSSEEFWDYEHQVDLEAFSSNTFYNLLLKHSVSVTARLGQLTTEVKELYQCVLEKLHLLHPCLVEDDTQGDIHDKMKREVEKEVVRRRSLAAQLRTLLHSQLQVLRREQQAQQKVHSVFTAQVRECTRILGKVHQISHAPDHQNLIQRLRSLVGEMGGVVSAECQRQGSWGLLGEGTGAKLLCPDSGTVMHKGNIFGSDGSLQDGCPAHYDAASGLIRPNAHSQMLLGDGHIVAIPSDFFLHPQTGRVLPILGNVAYDPKSSTLVFTTDSCAGDNRKWESPLIPFIPYPTSSHSDQALPSIRLRGLRPGQKLQLSAPMADADTGVPVPVLAVTIHPQTGQVYPLGRTYLCPITRLLQPVQIGYPMLDPKSGNIVLTVGISLDPMTGVVLPVGGVLLGESFIEPLSGKMARVGGASIQDGQLVPHAGGYQTLLDNKVLGVMFKIVELLRAMSEESGLETLLQGGEQGRYWQDRIGAAALELHRHWSTSQHCQLQLQTRLEIMLDTMVGLHQNGGSLGLVAIRYGSQAVDPVTAAVAPVVGARLDALTNTVVPVTASYWLAEADQTDSTQVEALKKEMSARNTYWQQQRRREEDVLSGADSTVFRCFLRLTEAGCHQEVQWSGKRLREAAVELHHIAQAEAQRRAAQRATLVLMLPLHVVNILSLVDEEEWDQHCVWYTELVSALDMVDVCMQKLQQEQDRETRLGEMWEQCSSRLSDLDVALIKLHLVRHLSNLRGDTAQAVLCGNFWYKEYGLIRFCQPKPSGNLASLLQWKLLPLLERMNQQFAADKQQATLNASGSHQWTFGIDLQPDRDKSPTRFVGVMESQWKCEGELIPVNLSTLNPREFRMYQHGLFLIHTLHALQLVPSVSLQLAVSLPNNNYHNNAFRNSFFYQEADETLFVRRQRLQSAGDFLLLLLHCLSHVAIKNMSNDSAPAFGSLFYKVLQASLGELFQAKLGLDSTAHEVHKSFRDDESAWGQSKSFSLLHCGESSGLSQHDIEDLERKNSETSLLPQLEGVLRKRNTVTEGDRKHSF
ncbi:uncharacterized protein si:dkey-103g5.4 isoform X2 [Syngnathoides biaculeatus]|uniref:uncharacterized protein si:dkey-103g5.4 isoform X2 n=1 Tax=Syngnathoides biaculeatus TaxID=300417 RepID=UPI002ADD8BC1|nr:uncharacterized protein si:dkey-103g5.4 isoform X2 [Syngnathoides biaculeatus]